MLKVAVLNSIFYGKDLIIDIFSALVLLFLFINIMKYLLIDRRNLNYKLLSAGFFILMLSFIAKVASNFVIYYTSSETRQIGVITVVHQSITSSGALVLWGLLIYRLLSILGLFLIYIVYSKQQKLPAILFAVYFLLLVGIFSHTEYYIFHLTTLFLISLFTVNLLRNYQEKKFGKTKWLLASFGVIGLSQGVFLFIKFDPLVYIAAELIQLVGYSVLLITFLKVLRDGKKKGKN